MRDKRPSGLGSISNTPRGFRARGPRQPDGSRLDFGVHPTRELAEEALVAAVQVQRGGLKREGCPSFAAVAETVLDERERNGIRGISQERYRFRMHLKTSHFADMPIDRITTADGARWLRAMSEKKAKDRRGPRLISVATIRRALALASVILDAAGPQERALIDSNPFQGLKVKRRAGTEATKDVEVFLTLEEQKAVRACPAIPEHERWLVLFGFGCGVRMGEQHNLELRDVHADDAEPHVIVRFGSNGQPRKNGQKLRVELFGFALEAARAQLELLKGQPNPLGLLFPTLTGCRRKGKPLGNGAFRPSPGGTHILVSGKPKRVKKGTGSHVYVDRFKEVLALAGITRHVRWHDLRHSCASSLLQGEWGDPWTMQEVKEQLGHSSVTVTERYAHFGETARKRAAKKVRFGADPDNYGIRVRVEPAAVGHALVTEPGTVASTNGGAGSSIAAIASLFDALETVSLLVGRAGHDPATYGLKGPGMLEALRVLASEKGLDDQRVTNVAAALASLPSLPACAPPMTSPVPTRAPSS